MALAPLLPRPAAALAALLGGAALLLAACGGGGRATFILLPDPDGSVGEITVTRDGSPRVVDRAWHAVAVEPGQAAPSEPVAVSPAQVEAEFGEVFRAAPVAPAHFRLQFESDSTRLTPESAALLPEIVAEIRRRGSVDTSVVGHTDTAGAAEYNYTLSLQRARAVAELLVAAGVDEEILEIGSHGEGNPLVPTADGVAEPRNRRVEITVR